MGEKPGTRVFKKSSPNCKLTVYLGKRDFVDHLDKVDPVDTPESSMLRHTAARPRGYREGLRRRL
ncbi:ARRB2 isoform 11 [Pan troglodytes]|uniref:Beta-arrestin-2 n=1 Tax=Pan troglodytes TaxID=9598 RepID=A0A2J8KQS3_PANTR|nr:ARRB2 isoform 11 [Pan troglodytes]